MIPLVTSQQTAIATLCRQFGVVRLDLFGSAANGTFDPAKSDLDFVAEFANPSPTAEYSDRFLDFAASLESLLGRPVDLVSASAVRGSRLEQAIAALRHPVYVESTPVAV